MDRITKEANPDENDLSELLFADDQSLPHRTEDALQLYTPPVYIRIAENTT